MMSYGPVMGYSLLAVRVTRDTDIGAKFTDDDVPETS